MNLSDIQTIPPVALYFIFIWSLLWKGLSLWHAAKLKQRNWFIAILVLNTIGILEIVYLFVFAKEKFKLQTLMFWQKNK